MATSTYLRNAILNKVLRNTDFTVTAAYVSLHTADPGLTGASEVTGGSYARQLVAFDAAASGATQNTAIEDFTNMPAATVTHGGVWDALTSGNFLYGNALAASKTVNSGDTFRFPIADIDASQT